MKLALPHPVILLSIAIAIAAVLTGVLPAGEYDRRDDAATGRRIVVPGTYHAVPRAPVGFFAAVMAAPRGFDEAVEIIAVVLFVGGAWVVVDRIGTLGRVVTALSSLFGSRGWIAIAVISLFFATMGALENMQEEIIPLVPVLLLLGKQLSVDAVDVVAMSAGAAMIGSAFGPTNPFQAGIALKLAQLPPLSNGGLRLGMFVAGVALWIGWTMRHAMQSRLRMPRISEKTPAASPYLSARDWLVSMLILMPMPAYVYGSLRLDWGFNELSAAFLIGAVAAGLVGRLGARGTVLAYLDGMQALLPAAVLIGLARSISLVLTDGHVIDTILHGLATPLGGLPGSVAMFLMIPLQALIHVIVPSVSGQAVLTMPVLVPLADLLRQSRQLAVLAYQTGAGLAELLTPTNGALMAVLLAAGVSYKDWARFAVIGVGLALTVFVSGMIAILLR
jgi:uncharacterized ion transporter superfamily protein YfcC